MIRRVSVVLLLIMPIFGASVRAGNPLFARDDAPLRWDTSGAVTWNPDGGKLGAWNTATAANEVEAAFDMWEAVPTAVITFQRGSQITNPSTGLPTDVTSANFAAVLNANNGENPVIYDNGLDILTAFGLPPTILGYASAFEGTGAMIDKAFILMNGDWIDGRPSGVGEIALPGFRHALVHEVGHFSGLGHSSVNHELTTGIGVCPLPTLAQQATMRPYTETLDQPQLHHDDVMMLSHLYPSATFNTDNARIRGVILWRDGVIPIDGANMVLRPITGNCNDVYELAQGVQAGSSNGEFGGRGYYEFPGLAPGGSYSLLSTSILDGYQYPLDPSIIDDDYWNFDEDYFDPPDDPTVIDPVVAGAAGTTTAGFDIFINNPAGPGAIAISGADALRIARLDGEESLPGESLAVDIEFGQKQVSIPAGARLAWINRFSPRPDQLPLRIERLEAWFSRGQPITGRPIRILVYTDPAGTGDIANATLVFSQDTVIPAPGLGAPPFDFYPLSAPVEITGGDFYVGFYDLISDGTWAFGFYDQFISGAAYTAVNSTLPTSFAPLAAGNFYVRAHVTITPPADSVMLSWGDPCNVAAFDGQDFAVYEGSMASFSAILDHQSITCSTNLAKTWIVPPDVGDRFWLVTPKVGVREGELGTGTGGASRAPAATCATTQADPCP